MIRMMGGWIRARFRSAGSWGRAAQALQRMCQMCQGRPRAERESDLTAGTVLPGNVDGVGRRVGQQRGPGAVRYRPEAVGMPQSGHLGLGVWPTRRVAGVRARRGVGVYGGRARRLLRKDKEGNSAPIRLQTGEAVISSVVGRGTKGTGGPMGERCLFRLFTRFRG